jgi:purine catabolism regulator
VSLLDPAGFPLASAGVPVTGTSAATTTLALPGGGGERFTLRIRGGDEGQFLQPLLGPVAAVLAMQLSYTLAASSPLHSPAAARLVEAMLDDDASTDALRVLAQAAGLDPDTSSRILVVSPDPESSTANARLVAWRAQVHLEARFGVVRFFEHPERTVFLLQRPEASDDSPHNLSAAFDLTRVGVIRSGDRSWDELPLALRMAMRQSHAAGVRTLPALDLASIAQSLPSPGLASLAARVVAPLNDADPTGVLTATLGAYLRHSGAARAIGEELFIHRNTLAYRIRRIEALLDVDLQDGETRATLLLALHIVSA